MTNIVFIARDRFSLTHQSLYTLYKNTPHNSHTLTIVDDGSERQTQSVITDWATEFGNNCEVVTFLHPISILGFLRNVGAWASERFFGRGDYLCFLDNDIAALRPDWLQKMEAATQGLAVVGGCRHPYHGVNSRWDGCEATDAVAGYSLLMKWETWDSCGPFDQHAKGTGQSEDYALCRKAIDQGRLVGYTHPPVLAHCGITDSNGKPATGHEAFVREPRILYL